MGFFSREKKEKTRTEQVNYFEIGHTGQASQFREALESVYEPSQRFLALGKGAMQAFNEGRPENMQILCHALHKFSEHSSLNILLQLINSAHSEPADALASAFKTTSEANRKNILTRSLIYVCNAEDIKKYESFIEAALKNGADANTVEDGFPGSLLAKAVCEDASQHITDLLLTYGADANGALARANDRTKYTDAHKDILKGYVEKQKKLAAGVNPVTPRRVSAAQESDIRTILRQMQENIADLTEQVRAVAKQTACVPGLEEKIGDIGHSVDGLIEVIGYLVEDKKEQNAPREDGAQQAQNNPPAQRRPPAP